MKNLTLLLSLFLFLSAHSQISYETPFTGLGYPEWDGGRTGLEFADINQDGHVDFLSIGDHGSPYFNTDEHGVMAYLGDGNGHFGVQQYGGFGYGGIAVGDVNNDGHLDVGYGMHHNYSGTDLGDQLIEVALGDGSGMMWTAWDDGLATNGETWGMFGTDFADVDIDGDLDLVSISFGGGAGIHVYLNNMGGTWTQSFGFNGGNSDEIIHFGDINNDGFPDIAAGHSYGTAYFGDGTGHFELHNENLPFSDYPLRGIAMGDADNDGGQDLSFVIDGAPRVWCWNNDNQQWEDFSGILPTTGSYQMTALNDINTDGFADVLAYGGGQGTIWLGNGQGQWEETASFTTGDDGGCQALITGRDIDHNGFPDIVLLAEEEQGWDVYQNFLYGRMEDSEPEGLTVKAAFPKGHEHFFANSIQRIRWHSAVPGNVSSTVDIELSTEGTTGLWVLIAEDIPNNGRYQWAVPDIESEECYLRFTAKTSTDQVTATTQTPFTILANPGTNQPEGPVVSHSLKIYPNPCKGAFFIEPGLAGVTGVTSHSVKLEIRNMKGQVVLSRPLPENVLSGRHPVKVNQLPPGTYFLSVQSANMSYQAKLLKR